MTTFDKREEGFEKKFAMDADQKFKAEARRNRLLGLWAAEKLGITGDAATAYAKEVVAADFEEAGDADVVRKVLGDFTAKGIAMTEAAASREDGRADGGGRHAGEGGNVEAQAKLNSSIRLLRHSAVRDDRPRRDDLQQPPRRRAEKAAAARHRDDIVAGDEIADPDGRSAEDASSSAALLCDSSAMPKPASTRRFWAVRLSTGVHVDVPNPWVWNSAKTCDAAISRRPGTIGKCDPALTAQLGQFRDTAAGARVIRRAYDLERLGKQQLRSRDRANASWS